MVSKGQLVADLVSAWLGWLVVLVGLSLSPGVRSVAESVVLAVAAGVLVPVLLAYRGQYLGRPTPPRTDEVASLLFAVGLGTVGVAALSAVSGWPVSVSELLVGAVTVFSVRSVERSVLREVGVSFRWADTRVPVVVVGVGEEAAELVELITDHPESRLKLLGVIGDRRVALRAGLGSCWLGGTETMVATMRRVGASAAVVTPTGFRAAQFKAVTGELFAAGFDIHVSAGVSRLARSRYRVRSLAHEPVVVLRHQGRVMAGVPGRVKRCVDVVGAVVGLVVAAPVMAAAAAAVKASDGGPVLYRSERVGRFGVPFQMVKFRSMRVGADREVDGLAAGNERVGPLFKMSDDPRVTRVGRVLRDWSVDELPQLWNVLRGDMSLVGPRPALPAEVDQFDEELRSRFRVPPGLTGLWQVEARSNAQFSAYRRLDLQYVENWGLWFDILIVLATIDQLVSRVAIKPLVRLFGGRADGAPVAVPTVRVPARIARSLEDPVRVGG